MYGVISPNATKKRLVEYRLKSSQEHIALSYFDMPGAVGNVDGWACRVPLIYDKLRKRCKK